MEISDFDLDEILQLGFIFLLIPTKIISYFLNFNPLLVYIFLLSCFFILFVGFSLSPIHNKPGRYNLNDMSSIVIILLIPAIIITYILRYEILFPAIYSILLVISFVYIFKKWSKNIIELV